jgi:predicted dehydrogenase
MSAVPAPLPPVRLGLVGLGFGRHLARALLALPGVTLVAVADRRATPALLAELALPGSTRLHADAVTMVATEQLDGIVIATAPGGRAPLLAACAARGLPLFVEKPWAGNPAQARRFSTAVAPIAERVMLGFSFRFHPAVRRLRELLDGELGPVWMANGEYAFDWNLGPDGWLWDPESGGGVFNENSCHLLDVLCHLAGRPVSVQAAVFNPRGRPSAELGAVTLTFANGAVAALTLGAHAAGAMDDFPRLDLVTAQGRACLRGRGHVWTGLTWALRGEPEARTFSAAPEYLGETRYSEALRRFVACIRDKTTPPATLADGLFAVDLAAAIAESAATGLRVMLPAA